MPQPFGPHFLSSDPASDPALPFFFLGFFFLAGAAGGSCIKLQLSPNAQVFVACHDLQGLVGAAGELDLCLGVIWFKSFICSALALT